MPVELNARAARYNESMMHVCLFDIDGTLLSSGGAGKAAMYAALESEFEVRELYDSVPFAGRTDRAIAGDLFALHGIENCEAVWRRFVAGYLRHLPGCLLERQGRVLPGIAELLEQLRGRGDVAVGLLTGNMRAGARTKLDHFSLYHHFRFGGFGDRHLDRDCVASEALDELRRFLGSPVDLARVWVIGDTPLDIRCARSIGARVAGVATGQHTTDELAAERPDLLLSDLADPAPLLARLG